jgi:replication initiation protein RepC
MITSHAATTPFGRRSLTLGHVASGLVAKQRPAQAAAHKWNVFRALCAAKDRLGLSERSLAVLDALLSFHPETVLSGEELVVFPSNAQLSLRAHGMPASTLRRHLAALVEAGIVLRRDSPNGKRYARKGRDGALATAFGFDLAPLVARAAEFEALAEEVRAAERALRYARERITLARRDIAKMIATGIEAGAPTGAAAGWSELHGRFRALIAQIPRRGGLGELEPVAERLAGLAAQILNILERCVKDRNPSANESRIERHLQNSNPESLPELEPAFEESGGGEPAPHKIETAKAAEPPRAGESAFPLRLVLKACPDIADYARGGVADWRDLKAAAAVARAALGVSPSAYQAAQAAMGETPAAIVVAAILQRGPAIASAGGYLRELTRKAEANAFSPGPMLMALVGARERERRRA